MSEDKVPTGKIERASKFLQTGLKVGGQYLKHYGKKALLQNPDKADLDEAVATNIFEGFANLRGSALKVAQMLSMDQLNLSASFTNVLQKAQYSVPPMSAPLAINAFTKSMGKSPEKVFDKFDPNAFKAASMGQVHIAYKDGQKLAVKIQYPGVADSVKSDIAMVASVAHRFVNASAKEMAPYIEEIESRLLEEADYRKELQNSLDFSAACAHIDNIVFPRYFPEYSSDRVITMEWIDGVHMKEFIESKPSKEVTQRAAQALYELYEYQIHVLKKLNADPHPGNFLFQPDGKLGVLDFGCVKVLTNEMHDNYFRLGKIGLFDNEPEAERVMLLLEILRPTDSHEKRKHLTALFRKLITLTASPYHDGFFNFNNDAFYQEITDTLMEISKLREIRGSKDFLFLNRAYFGLFAMFRELDAQLETRCKYYDFSQ